MADYAALPLFTDAYMADCSHLSDAEHGRYLLLLMLMWRSPGCRVPNDREWLARKLRRTVEAVDAEIMPLVREFCQTDGNWITQKRLTKENKYVAQRSRRQSDNAKSGHSKRKSHATAVPECDEWQASGSAPTPTPTPTPTIIDAAVDSRARVRAELEAAWPRLGNDMADVRIYSSMPMVDGWLGDGADLEADVLPTISRIASQMAAKGQGPPNSLKYFAQAVADAKATRSQGLPNGHAANAHGSQPRRYANGGAPSHAGRYPSGGRQTDGSITGALAFLARQRAENGDDS